MVEECPQCGNDTLRQTNVMATTGMIHRGCSNCCYRDKIRYDDKGYVGKPIIEHKIRWKKKLTDDDYKELKATRMAVDITPTTHEPKTKLVPGQVTLDV